MRKTTKPRPFENNPQALRAIRAVQNLGDWAEDVRKAFLDRAKRAADAEARCKDLTEALRVARKALEHDAPGSCWATGPLTGNFVADMLTCPGCSAIAAIDAALAKALADDTPF